MTSWWRQHLPPPLAIPANLEQGSHFVWVLGQDACWVLACQQRSWRQMSWQTLYVAIRTFMVIGGAWLGAGIVWAMLFTGLARWLFGLDEETSLLWVGLPVLIAFLPFCIFVLPKHLRKAGIL